MTFVFDDGGRRSAGYTGTTRDCVVRAIAIATGEPYGHVYAALNVAARTERQRSGRTRSSARTGVHKVTIRRYLSGLGWTWTPTMGIGTGCRVHLTDGELPMGRLIVSVSRHLTAVIDGVIHDTHDPQREPQHTYGPVPIMDADGQRRNPIIATSGGRCVYGYWRQA